MSVVAANAAGAATRRILAVGDSTTEVGRWAKRVLDNAVSYASSVQPTLLGTKGTGANKHEGISGATFSTFIAPGSPFWIPAGAGTYDKAKYLVTNSFSAPHVITWMLGINDAYGWATDAQAYEESVACMNRLDILIGFAAVAGWIPWKTSAPSALHLVCLPTMPSEEQNSFGLEYGIARTRAQYVRSLAILH